MFHGNVRLVDFELGTNLRKRVGGGGGKEFWGGEGIEMGNQNGLFVKLLLNFTSIPFD